MFWYKKLVSCAYFDPKIHFRAETYSNALKAQKQNATRDLFMSF